MMQNAILNIKPLGFQWETEDPFLFCVHHLDAYPRGNQEFGPATSLAGRNIGNDFTPQEGWRMYHGEKVPGFPVHPHRGFETVTIVLEGFVDHADSLGAAGRYGNGDVQWMTAGEGIQHSEMFPLLNTEKENPLELFQIWLNLPKAKKFSKAYFTMLWTDKIPVYKFKDSDGKSTNVKVIAGRIENCEAPAPPPDSWASDPMNEVAIWNISMEAGAEYQLPKASSYVKRSLFFHKGESISINDAKVSANRSINLIPDGDIVIKNGNSEAHLLFLQGRPINEPVYQYGPFVMNNEAEIRQAYQEYQNTRFGGWPWDRPDVVHPRSEGRFAIHADGRKETKA
ncbi:MAG: pirin family protein [Bacteroidales bacterium]|nr:pirin family protein [Bacteroidales bacterium]